ncbi:MAG: YebC/PmpR family DNA-binding transcriptional regulator [Thermoflexales bacterium]|nr:YebC/PmpR family DNA-binding transcriptional regulator [Thermoflexales bacterium]
MSGHSKWATIKRAKGAADAKRGALFTRLGREIAIAAREGGGNPESNFRLRLAIDKAKGANMPKDNIERAIARATGAGGEGIQLEELFYEGYLPQKVPAMIKVVTDNRNRTVAEVRKTITRAGGSLGEAGSVGWQFNRMGYFVIERAEGIDPDKVFEAALEGGAEDVKTGDEVIEVFTSVDQFRAVRDALQEAKIAVAEAELAMIPNTKTELDEEGAEKVLNAIEALEELDDVQTVYHNMS